MVKRTDLLAMSYYERAAFTGSNSGIRYRIEKSETDGSSCFLVTVWPEPFSFENTPDEKKTTHTEEFSEDGLVKIVQWINDQ